MLVSDSSAPQVCIIGAGPIGLELAVALQKNDISFEIVEKGTLGNTMGWWAPGTRWFSSNERIAIAGVPLLTRDQAKASREDYLTYLQGVARQFRLSVRTFETVTSVTRQADRFVIRTLSHRGEGTIRCQAVVLATGGTDHPRHLNVEGASLPHVDSYLREVHRYFGRDVLIVGGRNSAVEAALRLYQAGARVQLCHRGVGLPEDSIKYWLLPEIKGLIAACKIKAHFGMRPIRITPNEVELVSVERSDAAPRHVVADHVLTLIGYCQDPTLFHSAGVELVGEQQRPRIDPRTMESNIPGLYVAGTAVAGTQSSRYQLFLENCHVHVEKIVAHLTGQPFLSETAVEDEALSKLIASQPES